MKYYKLTITFEEEEITGGDEDAAPMTREEFLLVAGFPQQERWATFWRRQCMLSHTLSTPLDTLTEQWLDRMKEKHVIDAWHVEETD